MIDENVPPELNKKQQKAGAGLQKAKSGKTIEETYTKKTQLEHILLRPDTYGQHYEKLLDFYDFTINLLLFFSWIC